MGSQEMKEQKRAEKRQKRLAEKGALLSERWRVVRRLSPENSAQGSPNLGAPAKCPMSVWKH